MTMTLSVKSEQEMLKAIAWRIDKIPSKFKNKKNQFDLIKVQMMLDDYGKEYKDKKQECNI